MASYSTSKLGSDSNLRTMLDDCFPPSLIALSIESAYRNVLSDTTSGTYLNRKE